MERYSEVVGLPVICADNGKRIGIISDIVFYPKGKEVKALILERKGCEVGRKAILMEHIVSLGKDAVIINDYTCIKRLRLMKHKEQLGESGQVTGLRIYSKSGDDLGVVKDVLFDYKTRTIEGLEVSDGLLQDIVKGRNVLPLFGKVEFSEESVLVDKEAVEEMTSTGGGLKNLLEKD